MWFHDPYDFDFDRTAMCIIPCGTEGGEIPFCTYNRGVGLRQAVESQHRTCSVAEWHKTHGRHPIYSGGATIALPGLFDHVSSVKKDRPRRLQSTISPHSSTHCDCASSAK
jgi:hypothetical protein